MTGAWECACAVVWCQFHTADAGKSLAFPASAVWTRHERFWLLPDVSFVLLLRSWLRCEIHDSDQTNHCSSWHDPYIHSPGCPPLEHVPPGYQYLNVKTRANDSNLPVASQVGVTRCGNWMVSPFYLKTNDLSHRLFSQATVTTRTLSAFPGDLFPVFF